jgi:cytochrome P450
MDEGINELARYDSSVQLIARFATEDVTIGGKRVKKGSMISMLTGAANRDPERFPDPDRLDLTRDNRQFLVFGHGIHYCLGHYLARMEGRIAIQALIARYPRLRLGSVEPTWGKNWVMRSVASLPITV